MSPTWAVSSAGKSAALTSQRSLVRVQYRPLWPNQRFGWERMGKPPILFFIYSIRVYVGERVQYRPLWPNLFKTGMTIHLWGLTSVSRFEGSPVLDSLRSLENKGAVLIICNTCLNNFDLAGDVVVVIVGEMNTSFELQRRVAKALILWPDASSSGNPLYTARGIKVTTAIVPQSRSFHLKSRIFKIGHL